MLLAPVFLLGLLAIGLPLWLHRFQRDTREKQPFASLMLLEPTEIQRSRRHALQYLLLLALRIALLAAIVLAFAQPALPWRTPLLERQPGMLHVIVLDTSLSMQHGERWKRAIEQARRVIDRLSPADRAMLVTADARIRIVAGPVDAEAADELRAALSSLEPGVGRLDYGLLMTSAENWASGEALPKRLHVITDLQQSATPLQFADLEPPRGSELVLVDVGDTEFANAYVASAAVSERNSDVLEVVVRGLTSGMPPREVVLSIDGEERGRQRIVPGPSREERLAFAGLGLSTGEYRVVVALEPEDALPADDRFHLVIQRTEPRALVIAANRAGDDAAYFEAAVGALTAPRLAVERVAVSSLAESPLAEYAVLIVSDAGILSGETERAVERYLASGGTVLMTAGPRAAARETLPLSRHRIASGARDARRGSSRATRVSAVEESHAALRDASGWRSVRFFRHVPIEPQADDSVLIRLENGDPLLVEHRVGAGRLLLLTSPLGRDWNDLAIHPVFVRFVGEAARYLTGAAASPNVVVGAVLPTDARGRSGAQVFDPDGRRVLTLSDLAGAAPRVRAEKAGFYEIRGGGRSTWIAANPDTRESDLTRMPPESIERWRRLQSPAEPQPADPAAASAGSDMKAIWPWLLALAVTLAFIEPLVANSHLYVRRGGTA